MRGGDLHWIWKPYALYQDIDLVYIDHHNFDWTSYRSHRLLTGLRCSCLWRTRRFYQCSMWVIVPLFLLVIFDRAFLKPFSTSSRTSWTLDTYTSLMLLAPPLHLYSVSLALSWHCPKPSSTGLRNTTAAVRKRLHPEDLMHILMPLIRLCCWSQWPSNPIRLLGHSKRVSQYPQNSLSAHLYRYITK